MTYEITFYDERGKLQSVTDRSYRMARAIVKVLDERGEYVKVYRIDDVTWNIRAEIEEVTT